MHRLFGFVNYCVCETGSVLLVLPLFQVHSNETIGSVRQRVANKLKYKADQIQMVVNEKMVC